MIIKAQITNRKLIAKDTWEVTLSHTSDDFYFNAGQYIWLITPVERKAFSISSSSSDFKNIQIIFRENTQSDFKNFILDPQNSNIKIKGPHGFLRTPPEKEKTIYITGGVGIAPVLSILRRINDDNLNRDITLLFANHSLEEQFYMDEISDFKYVNNINVIGKITEKDLPIDKIAKYYVIGSQNVVENVAKMLSVAGIDIANIFFEENYPLNFTLDLDLTENSYFKLAVDQSINHIIMTDLNGKIMYANKAAEETTGYSFKEMQGNTPRLWGGLMDGAVYKEFWNTLKNEKKPFKGEFKNQRKNGDEYTALAMVSPILDTNGGLVGFLGIEQDITASKTSEENLKRLTELMVGRELEMLELKKRIKNG